MKESWRARAVRFAKRTISKALKKLDAGLCRTFEQHPWLTTQSGRKTITGAITLTASALIDIAPNWSPTLTTIEKYASPTVSILSVGLMLWGVAHKRVKHVQKSATQSKCAAVKIQSADTIKNAEEKTKC